MKRKINERAFKFTRDTLPTIEHIAQPLEKFNIKFFCFYRTFYSGEYFALQNKKVDIFKDFTLKINCNGEVFNNEFRKTHYLEPRIFAWPTKKSATSKDINSNILLKHNVSNGITIFKRGDSYIDTFNFGGDITDINLQNFLLNNVSLLKDFVKYFRLKASSLFAYSKDKVASFDKPIDMSHEQDIEHLNAQKLFKKTMSGNIFINHEQEFIKLTNREEECLLNITRGYSIKQIASILGISARTVEQHISNIKFKSNCKSRSDLVEMFFKL